MNATHIGRLFCRQGSHWNGVERGEDDAFQAEVSIYARKKEAQHTADRISLRTGRREAEAFERYSHIALLISQCASELASSVPFM